MASRIKREVVSDYDESGMDEFVNTEKTYEDDTPRQSSPSISKGWGAPTQERRETVKADYLKLKDNGKRIVKILEDEPAVRFRQHYINSARRSYTCPGGKICPLCQAGHRAGDRYQMNVVDMENPDVVVTWGFGNEVAKKLQEFAAETVTSPLNRENLYFQVYHVKVDGRIAPGTNVVPVKARDLEEDYNVLPLNSDEIEILEGKLYGEETIWISSERQLEDAAQDLTPNDTKRN